MSLLIALFDFDMPSLFPYLFQGAAIIGLVQLFVTQGFINAGILSRAATDGTRLSLSVVYLTSAVSTVVGLNVYLAVVRRKMALASAFSGALTMPIFTISALFASSFIGSGGVVLSPAVLVIVAVLMLVVNFGLFWLQRSAVTRVIANRSDFDVSRVAGNKPAFYSANRRLALPFAVHASKRRLGGVSDEGRG